MTGVNLLCLSLVGATDIGEFCIRRLHLGTLHHDVACEVPVSDVGAEFAASSLLALATTETACREDFVPEGVKQNRVKVVIKCKTYST